MLEKIMPLLTISGVIMGVLFSGSFKSMQFLVPWVFAFMTFSGSLSTNFKDLKKVAGNPVPVLAILLILHVFMPLIAFSTGMIVFPDEMHIVAGLVLLFAIPTGIVSFIWVSICKGNIMLTLTLILVDTLLSPFVVPYSLSVLIGAKVDLDVWGMMQSLIWMVVLPSIVGMALNQFTNGRVGKSYSSAFSPFSKIGLFFIVAINSSFVATYFHTMDLKLLSVAVTTFILAALGYLIGWLVCVLFKWDYDVKVSMIFNSGMRNNSVGAVLAISYFPPQVSLPIVFGLLFQQTIASLYSAAVRKTMDQQAASTDTISASAPQRTVGSRGAN
jgi:BASS family bile acid:Na+ symporter